MSWLIVAVVVAGLLGWLWVRAGERPEEFEATVTHVEREATRQEHLHLSTRYRVRVTYERDDGEDGSFVFEPDEPELRYSTLPDVAPGDRLVSGFSDQRPRRLPEVEATAFADRPLAWAHTGDPDVPYAVEVDGVRLVLEVDPRPKRFGMYLFADGALEGGVVGWPDAWSRPDEP